MSITRFYRYELRTIDVEAARSFYAALLGENVAPVVVPLPAEAAARGAPAHWLSHLGVDDVERAANAVVAHGATRLGPTRPASGGARGEVAIVRDPGGAVFALATAAAPAAPTVVRHVLNTADLGRTIAAYVELFGWHLTDRVDLGPLGVYQHFAWHAGGANVGSFSDITSRPGVHPHWLVHFPVPALAPALAAVRAAGGIALPPLTLPTGAQIAVCDDPQGAAFALEA